MPYQLIQTAKRILRLEETFQLDMSIYCTNGDDLERLLDKAEHSCGTSYCLAGYLAHADGYPKKYRYADSIGPAFDYTKYSKVLIGEDPNTHTSANWDWLFDSEWENSFEQAKARAQYVVDNHCIPEDFDPDENCTLNYLQEKGLCT